MTARGVLLLSLALNLALGAIWFFGPPKVPPPVATPASADNVTEDSVPSVAAKPSVAPPPNRAPSFSWHTLESEDYRQYIANLRAIGCPERLIRDIIVADLDDVCAQKLQVPAAQFPPWTSANRRRVIARDRAAKLYAIKAEKRAFVKELLGYEWDSHASEIWNQDSAMSLLLGFLPDLKASQLLSLTAKYHEAAAHIREDASYLLRDEDLARLRATHRDFQTELSLLLGPADAQEYQLRMQAVRFFPLHDLQFSGLEINHTELRELARLSLKVKDQTRDAFLDEPPPSDEESTRRWDQFETQVRKLLGPERWTDFQRAQDARFRESHDFATQNHLPANTAVSLYETRRATEEAAAALQADASFSTDERTVALGLLQKAAGDQLTAALGTNHSRYLESAGQWVNHLTAPPEVTTEAAP